VLTGKEMRAVGFFVRGDSTAVPSVVPEELLLQLQLATEIEVGHYHGTYCK
jgi:hypothetical protein